MRHPFRKRKCSCAAALIVLCQFLLYAAVSVAEPIRSVVAAGPSWEGFTCKDGTGLYHDLLAESFAQHGISVKRIYAPSERAYELVRQGEADFMTANDVPVHGLVASSHPLYENKFHAFFRKNTVKNWKGAQSLVGRQLVWRYGYYKPENFPSGIRYSELMTGEACLGMVILGRADFYIDDILLIQESIKSTKTPFNMDNFEVRPVGHRAYYPLFSTSKRGIKIRKLYEEGMDNLRQDGQLAPIFHKWGHTLPHFYKSHP